MRALDHALRELDLPALPAHIREPLLEQQFLAARKVTATARPDRCEQLILRDGRPVGRLVSARETHRLTLVRIELLPAEQGRGAGTEILGRLIADADADGLPLRTLVHRTNPRARALYRRLGFEETGGDEVQIKLERLPAGESGTS